MSPVLRNTALFAGMAALLVATGVFQSWNVSLTILQMGLISGIMALGVNIQWGYAGLLNVGVMGFAEPIIPAPTDRARSRDKPTGTRRFDLSGMHRRLASGSSGRRIRAPARRSSSREPSRDEDAGRPCERFETGHGPSSLRPSVTVSRAHPLLWSGHAVSGERSARRTGRKGKKEKGERRKEKGERRKAVAHPVGFEPTTFAFGAGLMGFPKHAIEPARAL